MNKTYPIYFYWKGVSPDRRQWKAASPLLEPVLVKVVVNIPKTSEYLDNVDDLNSDGDLPVLTLTGWKYCTEQLLTHSEEEVISNEEETFLDDWSRFDSEEWE